MEMNTFEKQNLQRRISIFLILTFLITWVGEFFLWRAGGLQNSKAQFFLALIMLVPAISTLLTRSITKEGLQNLWLRPDIKKHLKTYLAAWVGPGLLIIFGTVLYYLVFPNKFDGSMTIIKNSINALNPEGGSQLTSSQLQITVLSQFLMALFLSPILNFIPCLGEELGWRGYLLPKMAALVNRKKAILLSGLIWGIWHAPIIAMGYNYGTNYPGFPWLGIIGMTIFCMFVGSFFSWLTFRAQSALPAAIAHGALNGMAAIGVFFLNGTPEPFLGPYPVGILGGFGFIIVGILSYLKIEKANPDPTL